MELNYCVKYGKRLTMKSVRDEGEKNIVQTAKNIIMSGFIAYVNKNEFRISNEVNALEWFEIDKAKALVERENNYSGVHLNYCSKLISA